MDSAFFIVYLLVDAKCVFLMSHRVLRLRQGYTMSKRGTRLIILIA